MEKIRISHKRDSKIFLIAYIVVAAISVIFFKVKIEIILILGLNGALTFLMITLYNYVTFSFIYFSNQGLIFNTPLRKREIKWEELSIVLKNKEEYQVKIILKSYDFERKMTIDHLTIESLIDLAKKHCPKEHDLYKTIEDFSKNKKRLLFE